MKKMMEELKELREKDQKSKDRTKKYAERSRVKNILLAKKCEQAKIFVTDQEIDEYIKNMKK
jgi:hypothetical protein